MVISNQQSGSEAPPGHSVPVATIYQNSDQVAGILQQLYGEPLIVDESRESNLSHGDDRALSASGTAAGEGKIKAPLLGEVGVNATADLSSSGSWTSSSGTASRQQFVYSQAYYLHFVRQHLKQSGNLHSIASADDIESVIPGSFVEYTTSFDPVELTLALEVITPELVDAIAQRAVQKEFKGTFPEGADFEGVRVHAEKMRIEAESKGAFARSIATAVQADARQATTREYYGRISSEPALTAITVCEREHFITGDPDRLLDGRFTVFGKVISSVETDIPTFARNKLLRNFSADAFDQVVGRLRSSLSSGGGIYGLRPEQLIDLKLDSRVRGRSFRVLPLAVFS